MTWFNKHYTCPCGTQWWDEHDCLCNDRCPACDTEIEPDDYEEMDAELGMAIASACSPGGVTTGQIACPDRRGAQLATGHVGDNRRRGCGVRFGRHQTPAKIHVLQMADGGVLPCANPQAHLGCCETLALMKHA